MSSSKSKSKSNPKPASLGVKKQQAFIKEAIDTLMNILYRAPEETIHQRTIDSELKKLWRLGGKSEHPVEVLLNAASFPTHFRGQCPNVWVFSLSSASVWDRVLGSPC